MKRIWAPWRMEYIGNVEKGGCVFCKEQKKEDSKVHIISRKATCFSILNKYPYTNGHIMVSPKRHISRLSSLSKKELTDLITMVAEMQDLLLKKMHPHGVNVGLNLGRSAGAGIAGHLHFHIVPRWDGDTNFMSVVSDTRIISQALEDTYKLLKKKTGLRILNSGFSKKNAGRK